MLAGLLKGYRCTIHWYNLPGLVEEFDDLDVTPDLYTIDRDRFTCAGGAAATDMMLALIRTRHGTEVAESILEHMLADYIRPGDKAQSRRVSNRMVQLAVSEMQGHIQDPISLDAIAERVGSSRRTLERIFYANIGAPPWTALHGPAPRPRASTFGSDLHFDHSNVGCMRLRDTAALYPPLSTKVWRPALDGSYERVHRDLLEPEAWNEGSLPPSG